LMPALEMLELPLENFCCCQFSLFLYKLFSLLSPLPSNASSRWRPSPFISCFWIWNFV
jgi:hypothetical protein